MADQRSAFRFRLPWLPAASAPRATAPRSPARPTPAPRRAPETRVPSQPTSTTGTTPSSGQSTAQSPQKTAETQVPSPPRSTTTLLTSQSLDPKTPPQPTNATTTATPQIQSPTMDVPPSSATSRKAEIEAPRESIPAKASVAEKESTQTTQTQPPSQSTPPRAPIAANTQSATDTTRTSERPPFRPPGAASPQAPLPQPQASKTESQPSSPSRLTSQSRAASQPVSPSTATNQSRTLLQPSTPSRAASQSRATSLVSSPSRKGSPTPRTTSQPTSQPRTPSRSAGQTPTTSPASKVAKGQSTTATLTESTFPSKGETRPSSTSIQPSSSSADSPFSVLKKESKAIISEQQPTEQLQANEETKSGITDEFHAQTPVKTSTESNGTALQPFKESGRETTSTSTTPTGIPHTSTHTQESDTSTRTSEPESFPQDSKPEETKEVKEIMQGTEKKAKKEAIDTDDYHLTRDLASAVQTKEQLSFISQSEKAQQAVERKEVMPTPASNGKESKTTAQPRNKTVLVESLQKLPMTNGEHIPLHKDIRGDITKLVQKMAAGDPTQSTNEKPVCVITLAGENRGATMQLGTDSLKKASAVPIHRGYKVNPDESVETSTDGEGSFKVRSEDIKDTEDQAPEAFINSNIQGINNSIMLNGTITERNPGVHLVHSSFPINFKKSMAETEFHGREKTEFRAAHAQRPIYQPMVKRRCLRGLFLESSDSDPENTTKPRHHGCRVGCREKNEENKINVF